MNKLVSRFKVKVNEDYMHFECPKCKDKTKIKSYLPIKMSFLECRGCGFKNSEDDRLF